jgi:hypothetical protein
MTHMNWGKNYIFHKEFNIQNFISSIFLSEVTNLICFFRMKFITKNSADPRDHYIN